MARSCMNINLILLTLVCCLLALGLSARNPPQATSSRGGSHLTDSDAKALEEALKTSPDNLGARQQLISYYFTEMLTSRKPELGEKREQHVFWLIKHHPESDLAGSPEAGIIPMGFSQSTDGYQRGK